MIKNEFPEWIYSPVNDPMWNNLFERIEDALGFKLFIWQKTYICLLYTSPSPRD